MSVTAVPLQPVKRCTLAWLWGGVILALLLAGALACRGTMAAVAAKGTDAQFLAWNRTQYGVTTTASGLQYKVLKPGDGPHPTDNDVALVKYVGRLRDGTVFDSNDRGIPFAIKPGSVPGMPSAIPGFTEGLKLMSRGSLYRLWISPELGYGGKGTPNPAGAGNPLANSLLIFDVELVDFRSIAEIQQQMEQQQLQQQLQQMLQQQQRGGRGGAAGGGDPVPPPPPPGAGPGGQ